ncbi:P-loop NTPase [Candidatus Kuenenia sp.]|uniref:P-loop NTPase n=1 Tax=Candidatus Kuenenia sp. TaxID=2499824 RepID=UPI0032200EDA
MSQEMGVPLLGAIPIDIELRKGADKGMPLMAGTPGSKTTEVFEEIAGKVASYTSMVAK